MQQKQLWKTRKCRWLSGGSCERSWEGPSGKGREEVNLSPGLLGIGVYRTARVYTLEGLKASADFRIIQYWEHGDIQYLEYRQSMYGI